MKIVGRSERGIEKNRLYAQPYSSGLFAVKDTLSKERPGLHGNDPADCRVSGSLVPEFLPTGRIRKASSESVSRSSAAPGISAAAAGTHVSREVRNAATSSTPQTVELPRYVG